MKFHINRIQYTIIKTTLDLNHVTFIMKSLQLPIDSKKKALLLIELYIECMASHAKMLRENDLYRSVAPENETDLIAARSGAT